MHDFKEAAQQFDVEKWLSLRYDLRPSGPHNVSVSPCPFCGSAERKAYVNIGQSKGNGAWNTYCCHESGGLVDLVLAVEDFKERIEARAFVLSEATDDLFFVRPAKPAAAPAMSACVGLPTPLGLAKPNMMIHHRGKVVRLEDRLITKDIANQYELYVSNVGTYYDGEQRYDLDRRLVIPIFDQDANLLSWQARDLTGAAKKKYIFPSGVSVTNTLFGWKRGVTDNLDSLIVVEGFFQKIAWDRLGGDFAMSTVASFGKKLSERQMELVLGSRASTIYLAWDLDAMPEMCKVAQRLMGRKKVWIVPSLIPDPLPRDHDEASEAELMALFSEAVEATPGKIAELSARAALGHFKVK